MPSSLMASFSTRAGAARPVRTPWHMPEFRSVQGFRVPTQVFMAGPAAQRAWIVANHINGQDWRDHRERYWLRFAANLYRDRGRTDDWLGAMERLVELEGTFETLVRADLRAAYERWTTPQPREVDGVDLAKVVVHLREALPPGSPAIGIPASEHHVMIDQPLALVSALRGLFAGWP